MALNFMGGWGDRVETDVEAARRMQRSWQLIPQFPGVYSPWSLQQYPAGELHLEPVAEGDLDAVVAAVHMVTERINDGPRSTPGYYLEFVRERLDAPVAAGGPLLSYKVRCGFAGPRSVRNHLLMDADPAPSEQSLHEQLAALVRAWEPEHVSVCDYAFHKAQKHKTPQVRIGWLTYIRDDVPLDLAKVPDEVAVEARDGGRYLMLSGTPGEPSLDQAMALREALGYRR